MVLFTVIQNMLVICSARKAVTVLIAQKALTV